ncbi:ATP-dependent sacrificial sulfur transferase LarE [Mariniblastus sp.]|nr:ATP-dependent sacrificial sulfur transferase LarE [Mariniblastus sp.]MDB4670619.1 ATP-dependent sacrificial sulfur transferase LarE [Pirellulaceae bacterium]MDB4756717.1 ATP-dependent sacrificial sulfur transferase LarE [Mariniblastus sp.]
MSNPSPPITDALISNIRNQSRCLVAFSGGVDSAVVAKAAMEALGPNHCLAVTAVSPSLAEREQQIAVTVAKQIGIGHRLIETHEMDQSQYRANDGQRCFYCKSELYQKLTEIANKENFSAILNGTNSDDQTDYRPGLEAAEKFNVRSPLVDCGIDKKRVREVAKAWDLMVWDKPASPCLASRVAYHEVVDPKKLKMIELAEDWLLENGFREIRVRFHAGALARVEVSLGDLGRFLDDHFRETFLSRLKKIGFRYVTIDLEGFRSGNLNTALPTYQINN